MSEDRVEAIRRRAYAIWQQAGCPEGQHDAHWRQACDEIDPPEAVPAVPVEAAVKRGRPPGKASGPA